MAKVAETPMMVQYHEIKSQYPDAFVFYRLGDFYELFEDDAVLGAKLLELTLTARNKNSENPVPMAGIPHHAAQNYIDILVDQGHKVAIVEQMEDPATAKGMVKRDVVQLITPGTKLNSGMGNDKQNNYLAAVLPRDNRYFLSYIDLSTGELKTTTLKRFSDVIDELSSLEVKEIVLLKDDETTELGIANKLAERGLVISTQSDVNVNATVSFLTQPLVHENEAQVTTILLNYIFDTQRRNLDHIIPAQNYERLAYLKFNQDTRTNLDLVKNARTKKKAGSLLGLIDETKTAMGGRLLKQWLLRPLRDTEDINERLDVIEAFQNEFFVRGALQDHLKSVYDLERLAARAAMGTMNARELVQLKRSLSAIPGMKSVLSSSQGILNHASQRLEDMSDLAGLIDEAIVDDPPISIREGDIINDGFDSKIDEYRNVLSQNQKWLAQLESDERAATGINSLKVKYNKNFGFFIEVSRANVSKLEEGRYERKQTLTNAERFVTPELKEHERLINEAQLKRTEREYELFITIRERVKANISRLQKLARQVAQLDVLASLADVADNNRFVRPTFTDDNIINIKQGRHPVVEAILEAGEFVANDVNLDQNTAMQLITGPNMAGKSTYMRELALIVILGQMGSFVPAESAVLPIFDQIFTRIGANDDMAMGQSTFMVEMAEANLALQEASAHSLILFDELGRGTATYDGMALAQAIIEYLDAHVHAKTLFSTHYHELTALADKHENIKNVHVGAVEDESGELHFLHQIQQGPADKSYGIHVAALAGLPDELIANATTILSGLENQEALVPEPKASGLSEQVALFNVSDVDPKTETLFQKLDSINISTMTPLEALNVLAELQKLRK
ncbi:DNA mismatch repair protein MutS [Leuconostoc mesenteroides]|uniref:DNA mismatch repair protein MutS n=1 Tax=Leuconostoc mesenteroides subsp. mesenteroides (strain ATCC 8293 / DSM 20343 / BCRC 11652 / CCM 1803 / JCM 6124 / NCDO 523 / NBRC 100496 / NCIMB 8023 / NCTC 12954 / NRRL B-1118 / 37Y) TaxID=203120 RepID=MUTS_LEUMM|nr:DNA mismatch repair protein MutS [Leuconostoc mesenteroides]Q03VV4.1 RecName: Full=DNA mismatch repair protein MutS [Leuconostoc mesenteroides subsp. mesenteroides ATCC 8293]ABJ62668.1 DNA mismatch repair protein MutS [Leuconostoc mesenteroides subsp. mesenteroides ATCC 8293]KAA8346067.1 DNA mismatch repair protein MutS [Leuconostoc mesenteroides]MCM6833077.1 DNA mismatch repair protein MutS [Leuconostoc mesenteroides]MCS8586438.1 DNA mismatch repair protein MutS [Leuconostoc mesenteroides]